jgi:cysteine desulfuration protein SufE
MNTSSNREKTSVNLRKFKTRKQSDQRLPVKVWLQENKTDDKIVFTMIAVLTKGLLRYYWDFFNQKASDILEADMNFIDEIGLKEHLS